MSRKKTHEEFISEISTINPHIKIIGKYKAWNEKIACECMICGYNWESRPNNLLNNRGCPKCSLERRSNLRRKTQQQFLDEMKIYNSNIEVLGQYINNITPIKCRCKICGHIWDTSIPINLLRCSFCCPVCFGKHSGNRQIIGTEKYLERLKSINSSLIPMEEYINNSTSILHKCIICGGEYNYVPAYLLNSGHCVICQGNGSIVQYGINSLEDTHPDIASMIIDKKIPKRVSCVSSVKTDFICSNCGAIVKNKEISYVVKHGLSCKKCSDGVSYPMKFVVNVLEQLDIDYRTEVSFRDWHFDFYDRKYKPRYDIVFNNYIIEVDGGFHKRLHSKSKLSLDDVNYIDLMKDKLANSKGYKVIRIDAYKSDLEYMKNSVTNSKLSILFDLQNIDWNMCHNNAISSRVKEVCDIWNNCKNPSVQEVGKMSGYNPNSVRVWLKKGAKIRLCNYDPKQEMRKNSKKPHHNISVICLNHKTVFESLKSAAMNYNINDSSSISRSCKNRNYSGGKDPKNGEPLYWMYYKDYLNMEVV